MVHLHFLDISVSWESAKECGAGFAEAYETHFTFVACSLSIQHAFRNVDDDDDDDEDMLDGLARERETEREREQEMSDNSAYLIF
jgi:hypothetical protein